MDENEVYLQQIELELVELILKIRTLNVCIVERDEEDGAIDERKFDELQRKEEEVRQKLEALKAADDQSWQGLKQGLEDSVEDLRSAIQALFLF